MHCTLVPRAYPRCDHVVAHRLCGKYHRNQQPHHLRRYRLRVYVLQVALLRMPPLAVVQEQELIPALVTAPFPPHSLYVIWPFVPSPGPDQTAARIPRPSLCLFRYGLPHPSSHATTSSRHCRFKFYGCVNTNFSIKAISQKERDTCIPY